MPGIKPTAAEVEECVDYARELLNQPLTKGQMKRSLMAKFPRITTARTCETYLARAREIHLQDIGQTRESMRASAFGRYQAIALRELKKAEPNPFVELKAQERIDKLLGLESPLRTELSGPDGKPIPVEPVNREPIDFERLAQLRRGLLGLPSANGNGESVHPAHAAPEASPVPGTNGG